MPRKDGSSATIPIFVPLPFLNWLRQLLFRFLPWNSDQRSHLLRWIMTDFAAERRTLVSKLRTVRLLAVVLGILNLGVILHGGYLMVSVLQGCVGEDKLPFAAVLVFSVVRIMSMVGAGLAQMATAATIVNHPTETSITVDAVIRHERRMRYKRWLWWTRFGMVVTMLQFVGSLYLTFVVVREFSYNGKSRECFLGQDTESKGLKQILLIFFLVLVWLVVIIQCFTGSDVLRWRSFYATHDAAWKAHYQEVFDHGIREALCCLGRVKYLTILEEDEVYSVAQLLGDLMAYRASGTGHLELLAGLALMQMHRQSPTLHDELDEAPEAQIREAASIHQFAEAAYTGPLLDFGRNPVLFPCAWLYRQGVLTPWTRNRRPILEGDNWWRGHAAAFLKYVNVSPEALRRGRVSQKNREAAYFVVVLHDERSIVIAVRGTETPEDLITDGLCRECTLSADDLDGLIKNEHLPLDIKQGVLSSFPHYGHSGIVESARELFMQIDGSPGDEDDCPPKTTGFLSSLLGAGCECHGYTVRIVGHSLGGAVATFLGLRLYGRYPNLHVYSYGSLPCVDSVVAEACSDFVTSIVYNDEFSARLSVNSVVRLRAAATAALSDDSSADSAVIHKLARRIFHVNKHLESRVSKDPAPSCQLGIGTMEDNNQMYRRRHLKYTVKGGFFLCSHAMFCMLNMPTHLPWSSTGDDVSQLSSGSILQNSGISDKGGCTFAAGSGEPAQDFLCREETSLIDNSSSEVLKESLDAYSDSEVPRDGLFDCNNSNAVSFVGSGDLLSFRDQTSLFMDDAPSSIDVSSGEPLEMFLPGLIIHIVPDQRSILPLWKSWRSQDKKHDYRAFVANRENFRDIIVSPYMFLDHLPWRCHYAMQRVLEARKSHGQPDVDLLNGVHVV